MTRFLAVVALVAALCAPASAQEQPRAGGVLKAGLIGEAPTLDLHQTTAVITQQITWHIYETLYTYDKDLNPIPMLAEGHAIADGGRRYTITLRKGVRFHNGKEMTSADVVPSLQHWAKLSTTAKAVWKNVEAIEAKGPHTVVIYLKEPSGSLLYALGSPNNGGAIYPKEVLAAAGDAPVKEYIGTGPYRFVEHKPDRHVKLARFKEYSARSEAPNGYGGKRTAYIDEIYFIPVPEASVRLAGAETGEYNFAQQLRQDQFDRVKGQPALEAQITKPYGWITAVLDGALFYPEQGLMHSQTGVTGFNQKNKAKARQLLKEAGYTGQPVRWITTKEYEWMYNTALVASQQMEDAGFKVDLQVVDWATLVQRRGKPELYDIFSTGFTLNPDPAIATSIQCNWPGWWCPEEKEKLLADLARETDPKKRRAIIEKIQAIFYEDVGRIKFGDYFTLDVTRKEVRGFKPGPYLYFWNVWLAK
jgi:peptide/nickel transport system substrate-binding protein